MSKTAEKVKAIIFDFDGVIVDSFSANYGASSLFFYDLEEEEYKARFFGNIYQSKIDKKRKKTSVNYFEEYERRLLAISPGKNVLKTLERLKEKRLLFINSSTPEDSLEKYLEKYSLNNLFDEILGYNFSKSKVKKFKHLFNKYKLQPQDCIFVTDTLGDIKEANEVKLKTIAVDFGFHNSEILKRGKPFKIISDFEDLLN
ncbi:MAG: HAD family hydrolase [Candidatus Moranbacteria bacterium]|nr:HAD family hydrolase [Candidatus Moranbacteria bacterium]